MFAVKLANFLMFAVSEENTVWRVLRTSSAMVGPLRKSLEIFDSLRESSVAFGDLLKLSGIVVKWPKLLDIPNKMIYIGHLEPCLLLSGKNLLFQ